MQDKDTYIKELETKIKELEQKCKNSEIEEKNKTKKLFDTISNPIFAKDEKFVYTTCNEAFLQYLGKTREEIIGKTVYDIAPKNKADIYQKQDEELFNQKKLQIYETKVRYADGSDRDVIFHKTPIIDENGKIKGLVGSITDITDRKKAEESIKLSEEKYSKLFNGARDAIFLASAKTGIILDCNQAAQNLLGRSRKEIIGFNQKTLHPAEETEIKFSKTFKRHIEGKDGDILETMVLCSNGKLLNVLIHASIVNINDEPVVIGIFRDITEQKKTAEELQTISQRLKLATESAKLGVWDWDLQQNTMIWDARMLELYGLTKETFLGGVEAWKQGLHPTDSARAISDYQQALKGDKDFDLTFKVLHPNGAIKHIKANALVIRDSQGNATRMIGINSDITEQINMQSQLVHNDRLASIGTLAAGVAHEINNPLTIVMGNIDILNEKCKDLCQINCPEYLKRATKACNRIATIVNGLRVYARSDTDNLETIDIHKAIKETQVLITEIFTKENVVIETIFNCETPSITANMGKLQQVIMNILTNARDAIKESNNSGIIKIETSYTQDHAMISISDNGAGIDEKQKGHIFDAFYTTKAPGKGTGLGLSISNTIITSFGGSIKVESEKNIGTTFIISLPVKKTY